MSSTKNTGTQLNSGHSGTEPISAGSSGLHPTRGTEPISAGNSGRHPTRGTGPHFEAAHLNSVNKQICDLKTSNQGQEVDRHLMRLPPQVQERIDEVMKTLDLTPINLTDMRSLGYRILKHAEDASDQLRNSGASKE